MSLLIVWCGSIITLSCAILFLTLAISSKEQSEEKCSIYECGFSPISSANKPLNIKFFMVGVLFLVFDLEVVLLFPWSIRLSEEFLLTGGVFSCVFATLVIGLFCEWWGGGLD